MELRACVALRLLGADQMKRHLPHAADNVRIPKATPSRLPRCHVGTRTPQPCVPSHGVISRVHTTGSSVATALCAHLAPAPNRLLVSGAPQAPATEDSRGSAFSPRGANGSPRAREPAARVSSSGTLAATHWGKRGERVSWSLSRVPRRGAKSPLGRVPTRDWSGHTHTWTHACTRRGTLGALRNPG